MTVKEGWRGVERPGRGREPAVRWLVSSPCFTDRAVFPRVANANAIKEDLFILIILKEHWTLCSSGTLLLLIMSCCPWFWAAQLCFTSL